MDGAGANNVLSAETLELLDNGEEDEEFSPEDLAEDGEVEEEAGEEAEKDDDDDDDVILTRYVYTITFMRGAS